MRYITLHRNVIAQVKKQLSGELEMKKQNVWGKKLPWNKHQPRKMAIIATKTNLFHHRLSIMINFTVHLLSCLNTEHPRITLIDWRASRGGQQQIIQSFLLHEGDNMEPKHMSSVDPPQRLDSTSSYQIYQILRISHSKIPFYKKTEKSYMQI